MIEGSDQGIISDLGGMRIFGGTTPGKAGMSWNSELPAGMTLCVMLQGSVECSFETNKPRQSDLVNWGSQTFGRIMSVETVEMFHHLHTDTDMAGVFVHFEPEELVRILGTEAERLMERLQSPFETTVLGTCPRRIQALAWQMIGCPLQGASRRLYLSGKALELLAFSLDDQGDRCDTCPHRSSLSPGDVERLHAARSILLSDLANPPTLQELASQVGINVNKLKFGFNQLFGSPVYAFTKGVRLDEARLLLESSEYSVGEVARRFGYNAASFATAFRQRFGMSPSAYLASKCPYAGS